MYQKTHINTIINISTYQHINSTYQHIMVTVHTVFHVVRWIARGEVDVLVTHQVDASGLTMLDVLATGCPTTNESILSAKSVCNKPREAFRGLSYKQCVDGRGSFGANTVFEQIVFKRSCAFIRLTNRARWSCAFNPGR